MTSGGAIGSGRTYRELDNMFSRIVQNWHDPKFKRMYFLSPARNITEHCFRMFNEKFLRGTNKGTSSIKKNNIKFSNGVQIIFREIGTPFNQEEFYKREEFRGLDAFLVYEDHTVAEFKRLMYGDWEIPNKTMFKQYYMGEPYHREEDDGN